MGSKTVVIVVGLKEEMDRKVDDNGGESEKKIHGC